jgi:hypothetical protein
MQGEELFVSSMKFNMEINVVSVAADQLNLKIAKHVSVIRRSGKSISWIIVDQPWQVLDECFKDQMKLMLGNLDFAGLCSLMTMMKMWRYQEIITLGPAGFIVLKQ